MLPIVAPNSTIAVKISQVDSAKPSSTSATHLQRDEQHREAHHRQELHHPTADEACDDRRRGEHRDGELGGAGVGAVLDELDELLDPTDLRTEGEDVSDRDRDEESGSNGAARTSAPDGTTGAAPTTTRSPSGFQPSAAGSGRIMNQANGTMPTTNTSPSQGVRGGEPPVVDQPLGERRDHDPPDRQARRRDRQRHRSPLWNQRVTTVVAGTRPAAANATPNTPYTTNSCHCSSTWPSSAKRRTADESADDDHVADVVPSDQSGHHHADHATDDEEQGGGERDRL